MRPIATRIRRRTGRVVNRHLSARTRRQIEESRRALLAEVAGERDVTFIPLRGNRGDELIWAGARSLLRDVDHREIRREDLASADGSLALVAGSGGWCPDFNRFAPDVLVEVTERFDRVVLLPSTFVPTDEKVAGVLRSTPARLYARDRISQDLVAPLHPVAVAHDTAFFFDYGPWVRPGSGTLYALRADKARAVDWEAIGVDEDANDDISNTAWNLDQWLWRISGARYVHTDRAHVMIAAAMMGKSVTWYPTTDHKVQGIAEFGTAGLDLTPGIVARSC